MLVLSCPYCHIRADETELTPGGQAHLKRHATGLADEKSALVGRGLPRLPSASVGAAPDLQVSAHFLFTNILGGSGGQTAPRLRQGRTKAMTC